MVFKSAAQKAKFTEMLNEKKITKEVFKEWEKDTPKKLPERVHPKESVVTKVKKVKVK